MVGTVNHWLESFRSAEDCWLGNGTWHLRCDWVITDPHPMPNIAEVNTRSFLGVLLGYVKLEAVLFLSKC
jgi:hypothetical protein